MLYQIGSKCASVFKRVTEDEEMNERAEMASDSAEMSKCAVLGEKNKIET